MSYQTIGFLYPGNMGASLAWTLHTRQPHLELLTSLGSRGPDTKARAAHAGLQDIPLHELVDRSDVIVSILPPSAAVELAEQVVASLDKRSRKERPVYVDANAISPGTVSQIAKILKEKEVPFIDGSVIGGPANDNYDPMLYLSSAKEYETILRDVGTVLSGGGVKKGMMVSVMEGAGGGAASALKMAYGGIAKGTTGLAVLMVLAAHAHSPETSEALVKELGRSRPEALQGFTGGFEAVIPKAYRFVGEMEENAAFIKASLSSLPQADPKDAEAVAKTYEGLASVYQRVADDLRLASAKEGRSGGDDARAGEIDTMRQFSARGRQVLESAKKKN